MENMTTTQGTTAQETSSTTTTISYSARPEGSAPAGLSYVSCRDTGKAGAVTAHCLTKAFTAEDAEAFAKASPDAILSLMTRTRQAVFTEAARKRQSGVALDLAAIIAAAAESTGEGQARLSKELALNWLKGDGLTLLTSYAVEVGGLDPAAADTLTKIAAVAKAYLPALLDMVGASAARRLTLESGTAAAINHDKATAFLRYASDRGDGVAAALQRKLPYISILTAADLAAAF